MSKSPKTPDSSVKAQRKKTQHREVVPENTTTSHTDHNAPKSVAIKVATETPKQSRPSFFRSISRSAKNLVTKFFSKNAEVEGFLDSGESDESEDELESDGSEDELESDGSEDELESDGSEDELESDGSEDELESDGSEDELINPSFAIAAAANIDPSMLRAPTAIEVAPENPSRAEGSFTRFGSFVKNSSTSAFTLATQSAAKFKSLAKDASTSVAILATQPVRFVWDKLTPKRVKQIAETIEAQVKKINEEYGQAAGNFVKLFAAQFAINLTYAAATNDPKKPKNWDQLLSEAFASSAIYVSGSFFSGRFLRDAKTDQYTLAQALKESLISIAVSCGVSHTKEYIGALIGEEMLKIAIPDSANEPMVNLVTAQNRLITAALDGASSAVEVKLSQKLRNVITAESVQGAIKNIIKVAAISKDQGPSAALAKINEAIRDEAYKMTNVILDKIKQFPEPKDMPKALAETTAQLTKIAATSFITTYVFSKLRESIGMPAKMSSANLMAHNTPSEKRSKFKDEEIAAIKHLVSRSGESVPFSEEPHFEALRKTILTLLLESISGTLSEVSIADVVKNETAREFVIHGLGYVRELVEVSRLEVESYLNNSESQKLKAIISELEARIRDGEHDGEHDGKHIDQFGTIDQFKEHSNQTPDDVLLLAKKEQLQKLTLKKQELDAFRQLRHPERRYAEVAESKGGGTPPPPASTLAPPASTLAPPASTLAPPASTIAPPAPTLAPPAPTLAPPAPTQQNQTDSGNITSSGSASPSHTASGSFPQPRSGSNSHTASDSLSQSGSASQDQTASDGLSQSGSASQDQTASDSLSQSGSASQDQTASDGLPQSGSASQDQTASDSLSQSGSASQDQTASDGLPQSGSASPSQTASDSLSQSGSASPSQTASDSLSQSGSASPSQTASDSLSRSGSASQDQTASDGLPQSGSASQDQTASDSLSQSGSASQDQTASGNLPQSGSGSPSQTASGSLPQSGSGSNSHTASGSLPQSGSGSNSRTASDSFPQPRSGSNSHAASGSLPQSGSGSNSHTASGSLPQSGSGSNSHTASGSLPQSGSGSNSHTASGSLPQSGSGSNSHTASGSLPQSGSGSNSHTASGSLPQSGSGSNSHTASDSLPQSGSGSNSHTASGSLPQSGSGSNSHTASGSLPQSGSGSNSHTASGSLPQSGSGSNSHTASGSLPQSGSGSNSHTASGSLPQSGSGSNSHTASGSLPQSGSGSNSHTASGSLPQSGSGSNSHTASGSLPQSGSGSNSHTASGNLPQSGSGSPSQTASGSLPQSGSGSNSHTASDSFPQPGSGSNSHTASGSFPQPGSGSNSHTASGSFPQPGSGSNSRTASDSFPQPGSGSNSHTASDSFPQPGSGSNSHTASDSFPQPGSGSNSHTASDSFPQPGSGSNSHTASDSFPQPGSGSNSHTASGSFPQPGSGSNSHTASGSFPQPGSGSNSRTASDSFPQPGSGSNSHTASDSFPQPGSGSNSHTASDSFPQPGSGSNSHTASGSFPQPGSGSNSHTASGSFPQPGSGSNSRTASDSFPQPGSGSNSHTASDSFPQPGSGSNSRTASDSFPQPGSGSNSHTASGSFPQPGSGSNSHTASGSFPQPGSGSNSRTASDSFPQPGSGSNSRTASDSFPQPGSGSNSHTASGSFPQPGSGSNSHTASGSFPQPGSGSNSRTASDSLPQSGSASPSQTASLSITGTEIFTTTDAKTFAISPGYIPPQSCIASDKSQTWSQFFLFRNSVYCVEKISEDDSADASVPATSNPEAQAVATTHAAAESMAQRENLPENVRQNLDDQIAQYANSIVHNQESSPEEVSYAEAILSNIESGKINYETRVDVHFEMKLGGAAFYAILTHLIAGVSASNYISYNRRQNARQVRPFALEHKKEFDETFDSLYPIRTDSDLSKPFGEMAVEENSGFLSLTPQKVLLHDDTAQARLLLTMFHNVRRIYPELFNEEGVFKDVKPQKDGVKTVKVGALVLHLRKNGDLALKKGSHDLYPAGKTTSFFSKDTPKAEDVMRFREFLHDQLEQQASRPRLTAAALAAAAGKRISNPLERRGDAHNESVAIEIMTLSPELEKKRALSLTWLDTNTDAINTESFLDAFRNSSMQGLVLEADFTSEDAKSGQIIAINRASSSRKELWHLPHGGGVLPAASQSSVGIADAAALAYQAVMTIPAAVSKAIVNSKKSNVLQSFKDAAKTTSETAHKIARYSARTYDEKRGDLKGDATSIGSQLLARYHKYFTPKLDVEDPKLDVEDPKLDVEDPKLDVEDPKLDVEDPKLDVEDPKLDVEDPKLDVEDPKLDVKDPKLDVKDPNKIDLLAMAFATIKAKGSTIAGIELINKAGYAVMRFGFAPKAGQPDTRFCVGFNKDGEFTVYDSKLKPLKERDLKLDAESRSIYDRLKNIYKQQLANQEELERLRAEIAQESRAQNNALQQPAPLATDDEAQPATVATEEEQIPAPTALANNDSDANLVHSALMDPVATIQTPAPLPGLVETAATASEEAITEFAADAAREIASTPRTPSPAMSTGVHLEERYQEHFLDRAITLFADAILCSTNELMSAGFSETNMFVHHLAKVMEESIIHNDGKVTAISFENGEIGVKIPIISEEKNRTFLIMLRDNRPVVMEALFDEVSKMPVPRYFVPTEQDYEDLFSSLKNMKKHELANQLYQQRQAFQSAKIIETFLLTQSHLTDAQSRIANVVTSLAKNPELFGERFTSHTWHYDPKDPKNWSWDKKGENKAKLLEVILPLSYRTNGNDYSVIFEVTIDDKGGVKSVDLGFKIPSVSADAFHNLPEMNREIALKLLAQIEKNLKHAVVCPFPYSIKDQITAGLAEPANDGTHVETPQLATKERANADSRDSDAASAHNNDGSHVVTPQHAVEDYSGAAAGGDDDASVDSDFSMPSGSATANVGPLPDGDSSPMPTVQETSLSAGASLRAATAPTLQTANTLASDNRVETAQDKKMKLYLDLEKRGCRLGAFLSNKEDFLSNELDISKPTADVSSPGSASRLATALMQAR